MNQPSAGSQSEPPIGSPILRPAVPPAADTRPPMVIDEDLGPLASSEYRRQHRRSDPYSSDEGFAATTGSHQGADPGETEADPEWLISLDGSDRAASPSDATEDAAAWETALHAEDLIRGGIIDSDGVIPIEMLQPDDETEDQRLNENPGRGEPDWYAAASSVASDDEPTADDSNGMTAEAPAMVEEGPQGEPAGDPWREDDGSVSAGEAFGGTGESGLPAPAMEGSVWDSAGVNDDEDATEVFEQDGGDQSPWDPSQEDQEITSEAEIPGFAGEYAMPAAAEVPGGNSAVIEEIALRLERIADSLRNRDGSTAGDGDDPLEALITGYALGYSEGVRRASEGPHQGI